MAACAVVVVLLWNFLDFLIATLLLLKSKWTVHSWQNATADLKFCTCTTDLWLIAVFRFCLIIGALVGLRANPVQGHARLKLSRRPIFFLSFGIIVYALIKFLASTECVQEHSSKVWLWLFFGHTGIFSFTLTLSWWVLGQGSLQQPTLLVNADQEVGSVLQLGASTSQSDSDNESVESDDSSSDSESKSSKNKVTISRLLSVSKPDAHYLFLAFLCLLCAAVGEMFIPYYTGQVIDSIAIDKDVVKFHRSIIIMALLLFVTAICSGLRGGIFTLVLSRFYIRVNKLLFGAIIRQEIAFFDKHRTGDIVSRLTSDTSKMGEQVTLNINVFLRNVVTALGVCVMMFRISWKLTIITLISIPLVGVISEIYGNYFQKLSEKVQNSIAKANEIAEEVISSIKTVRSFANEDGAAREYAEKLDKTYSLNKKEALVYGGYTWCNHIMEAIVDLTTLYYGGFLVIRGELSGGGLVSFLLYSLSLGQAIEEIGDVYTGLVDAVGAAAKVFQYIDRKPKIPNDGTLAPSEVSGRVEFQNVSFSYPTRSDSDVLKNISFVVEPGEMVALVGSSGAGKSTCINLLQHFYEPNEGDVLIDGISVKELDHKVLHRKVALVGQEPVLFARNLKENIAYNFEPSRSTELDGLVTDAAKLANAHDFITELAQGYNTQAGEKGQQLSGGQKQRIAIARALIRKPSVVLFDEATSALDAESEYKIQEAMFRNLAGRTVIVVAHRFSTIEKANRIIVLNKGQIVEVGNHVELMANGGTYAKLVRHQLVKTGEEDDSSSGSDSSNGDDMSD